MWPCERGVLGESSDAPSPLGSVASRGDVVSVGSEPGWSGCGFGSPPGIPWVSGVTLGVSSCEWSRECCRWCRFFGFFFQLGISLALSW